MALRMPQRWGLANAPTALDFHRGLSAVILRSTPGEVASSAGVASIVCTAFGGARRHRLWYDNRVVHDGFLPSRKINIVPAGSTPRAVHEQACRVLQVFVPTAQLQAEAEQAGAGGAARGLALVNPLFAPDPPLEALMVQIAEAMTGKSWADRLWLDSLGAALTARLIQRWSNVAHAPVPVAERPPGARDWRVRRAAEYLDARIGEAVTLAELGEAVGLSDGHVSALFRTGLGMPPHRWLMRRRVQRACEMLAQPRPSITEIAQTCGFASSQHFATVFKKARGVTPSQFRQGALS